MVTLRGRVDVRPGNKHFRKRMTDYPNVFQKATGEVLFPGTLNVKVDMRVPVREHFRIRGTEINEAEEFLFEVCRINGIWAYRIRPYNLENGGGGWGDDVLEITCSQKLENVTPGAAVEIQLFRDS
jgi:CTP-dependent riboflavin kinase